jgi:hypothetical protein
MTTVEKLLYRLVSNGPGHGVAWQVLHSNEQAALPALEAAGLVYQNGPYVLATPLALRTIRGAF